MIFKKMIELLKPSSKIKIFVCQANNSKFHEVPPYGWLLCLKYVVFVMNHIPIKRLTRKTPVINVVCSFV